MSSSKLSWFNSFLLKQIKSLTALYSGHGVPSHLHRFARSWEAEACSSRNLRNQDRYICTQDGKIQCLDGWIGDLCQVFIMKNIKT